jgi:hypothetical protein
VLLLTDRQAHSSAGQMPAAALPPPPQQTHRGVGVNVKEARPTAVEGLLVLVPAQHTT